MIECKNCKHFRYFVYGPLAENGKCIKRNIINPKLCMDHKYNTTQNTYEVNGQVLNVWEYINYLEQTIEMMETKCVIIKQKGAK